MCAWYEALRSSAPSWLRPLLLMKPASIQSIQVSSTQQLDDLCQRKPETNIPPYSVELCGNLSLIYTFALPNVASINIGKAVESEAVRVMPLDIAELVLSYRLLDKPTDSEVYVEVCAVRKTILSKLQTLSESGYPTPEAIEAIQNQNTPSRVETMENTSGTSTSDLSEEGPAPNGHSFNIPDLRKLKWYRAIALIAGCMLIAACILTIPELYQKRLIDNLAYIDEELDKVRSKTARISRLQQLVKTRKKLSETITDYRNSQVSLLTLESVTASAPDDIVVEEFRLDKNRLFLRGRGENPEEWVIAIQKLPGFSNVRLSSALSLDGGTVRRFDIRLTVSHKPSLHSNALENKGERQ